jgi:hypothetical protein
VLVKRGAAIPLGYAITSYLVTRNLSGGHGMPCPYLNEKCSSQTGRTNTNQTDTACWWSLLGGRRRAHIAEGPEVERFQDAVLVFVH